jgi:transposase InsO family protein
MVDFIEEHRGVYGVESICSVLPIAPSTYYVHRARRLNPELRPDRAKQDDALSDKIERVEEQAFDGVYGAEKVWRQLKREGASVARCTVERLMRHMGIKGVVRGRRAPITTISDEMADRPSDLVHRQFHADSPNQLWVADISVPQQAAREMRVGPSQSAYRSRLQTTASGLGQKPWS